MCALKESLDNTVLYGGMNWFGLCDTLQDGVRTRVDDTSLKHSEYLPLSSEKTGPPLLPLVAVKSS